MKARIKVTEDIEYLSRVWTKEWAEQHTGQVYDAVIPEGDSWAHIEGTKFPKDAYTIITEVA